MGTVYDAVVIGAGPAGLSCAIMLAQMGARCLILERKKELADKVCGDGLTSRCLSALETLGISGNDLLAVGGSYICSKIVMKDGSAERIWYPEDNAYAKHAVGLARSTFDALLLERAIAAGCDVRFDARVRSIVQGPELCSIEGETVARRSILACGATGGRYLGIGIGATAPVGISCRVQGECDLPTDTFIFRYGTEIPQGYSWIFPVGRNLWNYGVWSADRNVELAKQFDEFEALLRAQHFGKMVYVRKPRGAFIAAGPCMPVTNPNLSGAKRIGDCAGHADPYSGEGISFAIEDGINCAVDILQDLCQSS